LQDYSIFTVRIVAVWPQPTLRLQRSASGYILGDTSKGKFNIPYSIPLTPTAPASV